VVALVALASWLNGFLDVRSGLGNEQLGLNGPSSSAASSPTNVTPSGSIVKPTKATVFMPDGEPDNPGSAGLAIDGDPSTAWSTTTYTDPQPFGDGRFKQGEGLLLQLPSPTVIGAVTIDVSSTGTKVQLRSSSTANPSKLDDTTALTSPTTLKPGSNTITLQSSAQPTSYLLVWISTMGTTNGGSRCDISEIKIQAAS
jgi:putative peptidoglycan lipid II flippase